MPDDYYVSQYSGEEIDAIARALPGGAIDITLQNNDPRNWGLGTSAKNLTSDYDLDTIIQNGWYRWGSSVPKNAPVTSSQNGKAYAFMRVSNYGPADCIQEFWNLNDDTKYKLQRICRTSAWQPIEWVNPPMLLGVEYRTTERYSGKPVYAKTINCGTVPLNTQKTVSMEVSGQLNKIRCNAWANSSSDAFTIPHKLSGTEVTATAASSANNIYISSNTDTLANYTIYATVYYTKATDKEGTT